MTDLMQMVFVKPWPWYVAGPLIGIYVVVFLYFKDRLLSASSTFTYMVDKLFPAKDTGFFADAAYQREPNWLGLYALGLLLGGLLGTGLTGTWHIADLNGLAQVYPVSLNGRLLILALGGLCIGAGTRMSGGCTSGHCIVGISAGQIPSMVSTGIFFGVAIAVSFVTEWLGHAGGVL